MPPNNPVIRFNFARTNVLRPFQRVTIKNVSEPFAIVSQTANPKTDPACLTPRPPITV